MLLGGLLGLYVRPRRSPGCSCSYPSTSPAAGASRTASCPITDPDWFRLADDVFYWGRAIVSGGRRRQHRLPLVATPARPRRRMTTPALIGAGLLAAGLVYDTIVRPRVERSAPLDQLRIFYVLAAARLAVGIALVIGLLRIRSTRAAVVDLVADLGHRSAARRARRRHRPGPRRPERRAASLVAGATTPTWTTTGSPSTVDEADPARAVTLIEQRGEPIAALTHDAALLEDPALVKAVDAAIRLASTTRSSPPSSRPSSPRSRRPAARIVAGRRRRATPHRTGPARRRPATPGHDRPGSPARRLPARASSDQPDVQAGPACRPSRTSGEAVEELRDLARGIHPAILSEAGLRRRPARRWPTARPSRSGWTVDLTDEPPAAVAATVYFSVAEALTNVAKHAAATAVAVQRPRASGDRLVVEVVDDGVGGARAPPGIGARRPGRSGRRPGWHAWTSPARPVGDTRVEVRLPCASS